MNVDADKTDAESDKHTAAMNEQLRDDVASWRAGRHDGSDASVAVTSPAVRSPSAAPVARVRKAKAAATAVQPADTRKKPFGMSYDGMSQADYITYRISRGAR